MRLPMYARAWGNRFALFAASLVVGLVGSLTVLGLPGTSALFTADYPDVVSLGAGRIFPGARVAPAFMVSDHSSGSASDESNPVAFPADGLTTTTSAWPSAFASDRYVDFSFTQQLPGNVAVTAASFDLSWASGGGTACMYFELRDTNGSLLDTEGSSGSPLSCTSSSSPVGLVTPLPGVALTDDANGARLRMYVASSASSAIVLDRAGLTVTYDGEDFALYPIDLTDVANGVPTIDHWGLAGP
jgi:hypothetical protein